MFSVGSRSKLWTALCGVLLGVSCGGERQGQGRWCRPLLRRRLRLVGPERGRRPFIAGDSTVSNYPDTASPNDQAGWGPMLKRYLREQVTVDNRAVGAARRGASSMNAGSSRS